MKCWKCGKEAFRLVRLTKGIYDDDVDEYVTCCLEHNPELVQITKDGLLTPAEYKLKC